MCPALGQSASQAREIQPTDQGASRARRRLWQGLGRHGRVCGPAFTERPCSITETASGSFGLIVVLMAWALADLAGRVVPGVDEAAEACQLRTCPGRHIDLALAAPGPGCVRSGGARGGGSPRVPGRIGRARHLTAPGRPLARGRRAPGLKVLVPGDTQVGKTTLTNCFPWIGADAVTCRRSGNRVPAARPAPTKAVRTASPEVAWPAMPCRCRPGDPLRELSWSCACFSASRSSVAGAGGSRLGAAQDEEAGFTRSRQPSRA